MNLTVDKPINRFCFGLHENGTGLEVIAVAFNDGSNEKIPLTVESLRWAVGMVKSAGVRVNSLNRLSLEHQKNWNDLMGDK